MVSYIKHKRCEGVQNNKKVSADLIRTVPLYQELLVLFDLNWAEGESLSNFLGLYERT